MVVEVMTSTSTTTFGQAIAQRGDALKEKHIVFRAQPIVRLPIDTERIRSEDLLEVCCECW